MSRTITVPRTTLWLLTVIVGVGLTLFSETALGQVVDEDHLKCYQIVKDENRGKIVIDELRTPQFVQGLETDCEVDQKAELFCAPTAKCRDDRSGCNDPRGSAVPTDFVCYKLKCPGAREERMLIFDQFSGPDGREIRIKGEKLLCTPADKQLLGLP